MITMTVCSGIPHLNGPANKPQDRCDWHSLYYVTFIHCISLCHVFTTLPTLKSQRHGGLTPRTVAWAAEREIPCPVKGQSHWQWQPVTLSPVLPQERQRQSQWVVPWRVSQRNGCGVGDGKIATETETQTPTQTQTLVVATISSWVAILWAAGPRLLAVGSWVFCLWFLAATCGLWLPHPQ